MKKEKIIHIIILTAGIFMLFVGIYFMNAAGKAHNGISGDGVVRASTSIEFGADFYTTSAEYTGLAANAVSDLYTNISLAIGWFFIFAGIMDICISFLLFDFSFIYKKQEKKSLPNDSDIILNSVYENSNDSEKTNHSDKINLPDEINHSDDIIHPDEFNHSDDIIHSDEINLSDDIIHPDESNTYSENELPEL